MAIINCPECNESISSTVKQCIHCGAKITVCPECNKVFPKECDICPECGFVIDKKATIEEPITEKSKLTHKPAYEIVAKWEKKNPLRILYKKPFLEILFTVISVLFFVLMLNELYSWIFQIISANKNSLYGLEDIWSSILNKDSVLSEVNKFLSLHIVFSFLSTLVSRNKSLISVIDFSFWSKIQALSLDKIISTSFSADFSKLVPEEAKERAIDTKFVLDVHLYNTSIEIKNKHLFNHSIYFISSVICDFFGYWFLSKMFEKMMQSVIDNMNMKEDYLEIIKIVIEDNIVVAIFLVCFVVASDIISGLLRKQLENMRLKWVEKNLPNYTSKYKKYMRDPDKFILNTIQNS